MSLPEADQEQKLLSLYPQFADHVRQFVLDARKHSMAVGVFCGLRTFDEQKSLYSKGRDSSGKVIDKKLVVTNAPAGMSFHNYGLAVDLVFDGDEIKPGWQWSWDDKYPWSKLANLGVSQFGLEPAYFWKSFPEAPHFQMSFGLNVTELLALYHDGGLSKVWTHLDKLMGPF